MQLGLFEVFYLLSGATGDGSFGPQAGHGLAKADGADYAEHKDQQQQAGGEDYDGGEASGYQKEQAHSCDYYRYRVCDDGYVGVAEAVVQQAVVEVGFVGGEHRASLDESAEHCKECVEDGDAEGKDGKCYADKSVGLCGGKHRRSGDHKSDKQRAAVAHEDLCGVKVKEQKADQ